MVVSTVPASIDLGNGWCFDGGRIILDGYAAVITVVGYYHLVKRRLGGEPDPGLAANKVLAWGQAATGLTSVRTGYGLCRQPLVPHENVLTSG